jgi:hypothetical protein
MKTSFIVLIGPFSHFIRSYIQKFRLLVNGCSAGRGGISLFFDSCDVTIHFRIRYLSRTVWSLTFLTPC